MSQAELAARLKISPSAVGMYEQGRREPSVDILVDMAEIFGVSMDLLLLGQANNPQAQSSFENMLRERVAVTASRPRFREDRPFSRQELAVLFAAMLMDG